MRDKHAPSLWLVAACATTAIASSMPAPTSAPMPPVLLARAECPSNMFQCPTSLGAVFSDVCCENGQTCALDNEDKAACCPSGVVCTGAAPTGNNPAPTQTQATSFVSNSYFSFPYAFTDFDDRAACTSAQDACSDNYEVCTSNLGGNQRDLAVTIEVPGGGGVTVGGSGEALPTSEAASICSSLYNEACSAVETADCDEYENGATPVGAQSVLFTRTAALLMAYSLGLLLG